MKKPKVKTEKIDLIITQEDLDAQWRARNEALRYMKKMGYLPKNSPMFPRMILITKIKSRK